MLKNGIETYSKNGVHYLIGNDSKPIRFKPWLGDCFSFLYDTIMHHSIFPKKFAADFDTHSKTLRAELANVHRRRVLELATGSGSACDFLPNDNDYCGTDISPGLLRRAVKKFRLAGFSKAVFYLSGADDLPFKEGSFDVCLCILSLNFFPDQAKSLREVHRVLPPGSVFVCVVPVPERNRLCSTIRGNLLSEQYLSQLLQNCCFKYESISSDNGALLYFRGIRQ
jgi:ubiquinone/menaquinone biosynthesis C-methylase UbiE